MGGCLPPKPPESIFTKLNAFLFEMLRKICETKHEHGGYLRGAAGMAADVIGAAVGFIGSDAHGYRD